MKREEAGKKKMLDYIRLTKAQDFEAGGITQQIFFPVEAIKQKICLFNKS
jgi:translation initiation factor IF-2